MNSVPKLLLAVFDFFLCLMVVMYGTSSLQWLKSESRLAVEQGNILPSIRQLETQLDGKSARNDELKRQRDRKRCDADEKENQVDGIASRRPDVRALEAERDRLNELLAKLQAEFSAQLRRIRFLQGQQEDLEIQHEQAEKHRKEAEKLAKELLKKRNAISDLETQLREEIARAERIKYERPVIPINMTPIFSEVDRPCVLVSLVEGTVAPLREPYYTVANYSNATVYVRARLGEPVDEALADRSGFQQLLDGIDPKRQFVALLVDSKSFETFRTVRELLRKRGIPFGWEPSNASQITESTTGEGTKLGTTG